MACETWWVRLMSQIVADRQQFVMLPINRILFLSPFADTDRLLPCRSETCGNWRLRYGRSGRGSG